MKRSALRRRILSRYDSLEGFAEACGVSNATMSNLISGRTYPSRNLIQSLVELLDIKQEEVGQLLFPELDE